jgi:hypothetical protein
MPSNAQMALPSQSSRNEALKDVNGGFEQIVWSKCSFTLFAGAALSALFPYQASMASTRNCAISRHFSAMLSII